MTRDDEKDVPEPAPYVSLEIPPGRPQIEWEKQIAQWVARGEVIRCYVETEPGSPCLPTVRVDGHRLTWEEFGELVAVFEGWGMRVTFVPQESLDTAPPVAIGEPDEERAASVQMAAAKPLGSA